MQVVSVPISLPVPHPQNTRQHPEANILAIMASIKKFGQQTPIVLGADHRILKGNGTFEACKRLKLASVFVVYSTLDQMNQLAYSVADNKTGESSTFDYTALSEVVRELQRAEFDVSALGFADFELQPLLNEDWAPTEMPEPEQGEMGTALRVKFTEEQAAVINAAVALYKAAGAVESKVEEVLVDLARAYVKSNRRAPVKQTGVPHA